MSPDRAAREARLMAETLASEAHDEAHARIRARITKAEPLGVFYARLREARERAA